jgi:hypothetical protein
MSCCVRQNKVENRRRATLRLYIRYLRAVVQHKDTLAFPQLTRESMSSKELILETSTGSLLVEVEEA